ncbi:ATP-binding cassette sub- A member 2 [Chytriomyces hyalinus]|nr:ATP-binding cassette sub- A member 2 [Chytriomyces hyalinus]
MRVQLQRYRRNPSTAVLLVVIPVLMTAIGLGLSFIKPMSFPPFPVTAFTGLTGFSNLSLAVVVSPPNPEIKATLLAGVIPSLKASYSKVSPVGQLSIDHFDSAAAVANADYLYSTYKDADRSYYPGGYIFNGSASSLSLNSGSSVDFGYTVLVDGAASFPGLATLMSQATHAALNTSLPPPKLLPFVTTFATGAVIDIGSQLLPPFIVNGLQGTLTLFGLTVIENYETGSTQQLFLSGLDPLSFFLASALIDYALYLMTSVILLIMLLAVGYGASIQCISEPSFAGYAFPIILFGLVVIPQAYCVSYFFRTKPAFSALSSMLVSVVVFVPWSIVNYVLKNQVSMSVDLLISFFVPNYGLYRAIAITALSFNTVAGPVTLGDVFSFKYLILPVMLLFLLQSAGLFAIAFLLMDLRRKNNTFQDFLRRLMNSQKTVTPEPSKVDLEAAVSSVAEASTEGEDDFKPDQVLLEEVDRLKGYATANTFDSDLQVAVEGVGKMVEISKSASSRAAAASKDSADAETAPAWGKRSKPEKKKLVILDDLWFGVRKGECFGFLGPNGAGKSTTMKILCGLEAPSWGQVRFSETDVLTTSKQPTEFLTNNIGYCPQHDSLWAHVTAREHLTLYATLRGVTDVKSAVDESLAGVAIEHPDLPSKSLSGGNKRRLMLAVATIGNPKLLFLDEPTTGVDVAIRRTIWQVIEKMKETSAIILTSHSMEEVDALADRVGILVNGKLRCLGTSQRLKSTYGSGYTISIRTSTPEIASTVASWFPEEMVKLRTLSGCTVTLDVVSHAVSVDASVQLLRELFAILKARDGVEDYSVSQATLQQVFVDFSTKQREVNL